MVRYSVYDSSERLAFQSVPYMVAAYTGGPGPAAYSAPDTTQAGTTYDGTSPSRPAGTLKGGVRGG